MFNDDHCARVLLEGDGEVGKGGKLCLLIFIIFSGIYTRCREVSDL